MHMADALLSPAVGGAMWVVSGAAVAWAARRIGKGRAAGGADRTALMGVMGAFVFAAQMINFAIPGTGSSGHLGGGLLLAILLGPEAAVLTITSVLVVQALFFADGGLLALGCNIFNMGILGAVVGYGLVYRPIAGAEPTRRRIFWGALAGAILTLQLGAGAVVLETTLSGISALPLSKFAMLMLPIHLAIGLVEGLATAGIVLFLAEARPELVRRRAGRPVRVGRLVAGLAVASVLVAGVLSWFASSRPDGLEWSLAGVTGAEELASPPDAAHAVAGRIQAATALMPDYDFKTAAAAAEPAPAIEVCASPVHPGTSAAGLLGALVTLALAGLMGWGLSRLRPAASPAPKEAG